MTKEKDNVPILVGGVGERNFGKQYRQGNRVYDSNGIAVCLTASPLGNTGGQTCLYLIRTNENRKEFGKENDYSR